MTQTAIVSTKLTESHQGGVDLGQQILSSLPDSPEVVLLFASPHYDHSALLAALNQTCHPQLLVGCSSAGEFTSAEQGEGLACALALSSPTMQFTATLGQSIRSDVADAAEHLAAGFRGQELEEEYPFHTAILLADAMAGHTDNLIEELTLLTQGTYQFVGGGAGDNAQFQYTPVFYGTEVIKDAAVALEICSKKPLGLGSNHGWTPNSQPFYVTESDGSRIIRVDDQPAVEIFKAHAHATGQALDLSAPISFFLHNLVGIDMGIGYKLRVPLVIEPDGSVVCAADVPTGSTICIMGATIQSAKQAAESATKTALQKMGGEQPAVALFFDCVATRLKMGQEFKSELDSVQHLLGPTRYVGCNTHGQVVRAEGQFSGFHNCTAVVCLLPD
ncbi:histidine kinase [Dictyobacter alpinus]|uniref:Histidine kinase n=1 Tax=Dictyobacter alpinus TaxID=2014873 RepID=A0A402BGD5_9CHLR|nr:FIST N-terminal domain-containing protein [Dictyobacter alpinus]GCE30312.1 histidine kinase [Dictyobacter alpinus]GCE30344.1 histidine kinase [Dictyobacter alpinus]